MRQNVLFVLVLHFRLLRNCFVLGRHAKGMSTKVLRNLTFFESSRQKSFSFSDDFF